MEIGTEISRKIRTAIKGKLQELGAYVDEELPDYIMVMVANKKSQEQMTDDLSLFLGSNTARFTTWLQGVLDKLRSVAPGHNNIKASEAIIFESSLPPLKSFSQGREEVLRDAPALAVSSTRQERYDVLSSISSHGQRTSSARLPSDNTARLTSAVKPLQELSPSEAVIDLKPDIDDSFDDDVSFASENVLLSRMRAATSAGYRTSRPTAELYRPPRSIQHIYNSTESSTNFQSLSQGSAAPAKPVNLPSSRSINTTRLYDPQGLNTFSETYRSALRSASNRASREEDVLRKRKIPVASSVVKVRRFDNEEEEEDEDEDYLSRTAGISSSVSVPARPERRPSLPPSKQANKNLILKAISEAQESVTKTTNYSTVPPQKQTVPVAPRTRLLPEEELILMQSRSSILSYHADVQELPEQKQEIEEVVSHRLDILSRLEPDLTEDNQFLNEGETESKRPVDSRSFILKRPKLSAAQIMQNIAPIPAHDVPSGRLIQPREVPSIEKPASPKFIVTLDGVPSPPGYASDQEPEEESMCFTEEGESFTEQYSSVTGGTQNYQMQLLEEPLGNADVLMESVPTQEKIRERCKYWPACKNADSCAYHHPTAPCKSFPKCKFADKCFFIHPNCKYDAKCSKADCPFTHASRRMPAPPTKSVPVQITQPTAPLCRFFPACKKTECPFYHPKPCRFSTLCRRPDCKYYHPSVAVPPRHALTWTRAQASE
ncbi:zinc finger CCCH domain-containing protein 14 [Bombina bombina]|uniref:zinc finger CCCH domain-containing protein 14 n=1 Tax=Bombina bombina TaxID=8345 RepID=UPI00235A9A76|nr:zinc finger CCCH domain-containing protein 14 [Bombina bombina]